MTNLARSGLAFVPPALFGAAKSRALVNLFMIHPKTWVKTVLGAEATFQFCT
jgi:hypothetical protein